MRKRIIILLILLLTVFIPNVSAELNTCYYDTSAGELQISYDSGDSSEATQNDINIDIFKKYIDKQFPTININNFLKIGDIQKSDITINASALECPTNMYIVVETRGSMNKPTFSGAIDTLRNFKDILSALLDRTITFDKLNQFTASTYSLFDITHIIYLMDAEAFNDSNFSKYKDTSGWEYETYRDRVASDISDATDGIISENVANIAVDIFYTINPVADVMTMFVAADISGEESLIKIGYVETHYVTSDEYKEDAYGNDGNASNVNCSNYSTAYNIYKTKAEEYASCTTDVCRNNARLEMITQKAVLRKACVDVLKSYSYGVSGQKECLESCANLTKDLSEIDEENNIDTVDTETCYLSKEGREFLANIYGWLKLIIPVLLIILSIFDFLRAIANEDEGMKRAKKHLINRLIAIALIYTLPSFIQFFLEKFGFVYEKCSIFMIKLLK